MLCERKEGTATAAAARLPVLLLLVIDYDRRADRAALCSLMSQETDLRAGRKY
jgi:hypothetical protein